MYSHFDVAGHNNSRSITSANCSRYHVQEFMSTMNSLSFNSTSDIQHAHPYSLDVSSQYVVPPQDKPMNKRIGFGNANYFANYS